MSTADNLFFRAFRCRLRLTQMHQPALTVIFRVEKVRTCSVQTPTRPAWSPWFSAVKTARVAIKRSHVEAGDGNRWRKPCAL
jgi:hypothetical protein